MRIHSSPSTLSSSPQQLCQANLAIEVHPVVGRVLGDDDQLADAVGRQFPCFAQNLFHRLGDMFAAHARDGAESAKAVAAFRDLQVRIMPGRDAKPGRVFLSPHGSGTEKRALFAVLGRGPIDHLGNFLSPENTDDLIDAGNFLQKGIFFPLRQTAGHHHGANPPLFLEFQHLADDAQRFLAGGFDEAAGIDHNDISAIGIGHQHKAFRRQLAQHAFRVDQVFGAAEGDEGEGSIYWHFILHEPLSSNRAVQMRY